GRHVRSPRPHRAEVIVGGVILLGEHYDVIDDLSHFPPDVSLATSARERAADIHCIPAKACGGTAALTDFLGNLPARTGSSTRPATASDRHARPAILICRIVNSGTSTLEPAAHSHGACRRR